MGNDLPPDDVAHAGVGGLGLQVGAQAALVGVELALHGRLVEVLHPALGGVDAGALLRGVEQALGVQRHGGLQVHPGAVGVLFVAGVQADPGIQVCIGVGVLAWRGVACAAPWGPVDVGADPGVFHLDALDAPAAGHALRGDAALAE